jgi:HAD superfamily hydrolase (TIGR01509 family)
VRLVVFDFDGTILDTETPVYTAWQEIYDEHGHVLELAKWAQCIGTADAFDPCVDLATLMGRALEAETLERRHRVRTDALIAEQALRPGVRERIEEAAGLGLALGVASSSGQAWVRGHLERLGLLDRFQAIRCAEDVPRVKPDPALYQAVLQALDITPADALALEDSPNGILAAKGAGLTCVAVPNGLTAQLDLGHADLVLHSLADVSLGELIARLRR